MRTTVDLPDSLLRALKSRAGLKKTTLAKEVQNLIEAGLRAAPVGGQMTRSRRSAPPTVSTPKGIVIPALSNKQLAQIELEEDMLRLARSSR